jgi:hypothetical protein
MAGKNRIRRKSSRLLAMCREIRGRCGAQVCDPQYGSIAADAYDHRVTLVRRSDILESPFGIQERVVGGSDQIMPSHCSRTIGLGRIQGEGSWKKFQFEQVAGRLWHKDGAMNSPSIIVPKRNLRIMVAPQPQKDSGVNWIVVRAEENNARVLVYGALISLPLYP